MSHVIQQNNVRSFFSRQEIAGSVNHLLISSQNVAKNLPVLALNYC